MKELSLNILDITENSVKAGATLTEIDILETKEKLVITVTDDGCGMDEQTLNGVCNPFFTTRTTRSVGMGIPLFKLAAEQTGGTFGITSFVKSDTSEYHGTKITAEFIKNSIDFTPLGDTVATVLTLIQGHPDTDFSFHHKKGENEVNLKTTELRSVLGDVSLAEYEVIKWIEDYLKEQYSFLK